MKIISVLHITDLHFGCKHTEERMSDNKDTALSITNRVGNSTWQKNFIDKIKQWINENGSIDCLVCTGDLADNGKITDEERIKRLEEGVVFLVKLCESILLPLEKLIITPGNHDLNRKNTITPFDELETICSKYGINNCATNKIVQIKVKEELNILGINSCMGATEKVETIDKEYFSKYVSEAHKSNKSDFDKIKIEECSYQKDLDIPAIGDEQTAQLMNDITNLRGYDSVVLLMHHNPIPLANIEIRPYANVIDGGRLISELLDTGKKVFILHGHTHFDHNLSSFIPSSEHDNYVSFLGGAPLNGSDNSKALIIRYFSSNRQIIKANIHEVKKQGSVFKLSSLFSIYDYKYKIDMSYEWNKLNKQLYKFDEIKNVMSFTGSDEDLIRNILLLEPKHFKLKNIHTDNFSDWEYIYIK